MVAAIVLDSYGNAEDMAAGKALCCGVGAAGVFWRVGVAEVLLLLLLLLVANGGLLDWGLLA